MGAVGVGRGRVGGPSTCKTGDVGWGPVGGSCLVCRGSGFGRAGWGATALCGVRNVVFSAQLGSPPRLARNRELDRSRARAPDDYVASPMLRREHLRGSFPLHPWWAALSGGAPELTCTCLATFMLFSLCFVTATPPGAVRGGRLWRPPRMELVLSVQLVLGLRVCLASSCCAHTCG